MATISCWFGNGGDWSVATDWISNLGSHTVPGAADDVTINDAGTYTVTGTFTRPTATM